MGCGGPWTQNRRRWEGGERGSLQASCLLPLPPLLLRMLPPPKRPLVAVCRVNKHQELPAGGKRGGGGEGGGGGGGEEGDRGGGEGRFFFFFFFAKLVEEQKTNTEQEKCLKHWFLPSP